MWQTVARILTFLAVSQPNLAQERYLSCSRVSEYCASDGVPFRNLVIGAGGVARQGKAGPKGAKGEPGQDGENGPPGIAPQVDLGGFERSILRKVKDWLTKCHFVYNDSCFLLVGSFGGRYSKDDFERECSAYDATLANIYGEDHRKKLTRFILKEIGNVYKELALGMTYDPQTSQITTAQGEPVTMTLTWHNTYPNGDSSFRNMFLSVNPDSSSLNMGMYNYKPQYLEFGVCEFRLEI